MAQKSILRTLYLSSRAVRTVVKDAGRARHIAAILARNGFAAALHRRRISRAKTRAEIAGAVGGESQDLPARVVAMFEELGPTFVKFGQILSTRPDLIPPRICLALQTLQDNVQQVPFEGIRAQVEVSLGGTLENLFEEFDPVPLASASIAQVHRAVTADGRDVVVKVQRPDIRRTIESDLSLLRFLAQRALDIYPEAELFDLEGMIAEFERSLIRELDFRQEATALSRFRENFAHKPKIHIPEVLRERSSDVVLTMERIRGKKLTQLDEADDKSAVAEMYLDAAYQMLFQDGFFHGDLHPGNVFLEEDGRLGIIDFGMVGRLSRPMREKVVDVIFSVLREDLEGVARIWYSLGTPIRAVNYTKFEADVVNILEKYAVGRPMDDIDIGGFLRELAQGAVHHGIRLPTDFTMMFKAMVTTEGLARQVASGVNPIAAARPYIEETIKERYSVDRLKSRAVTELVYLSELSQQLPGRVDRLLTVAEAGDLTVRLRNEDADAISVREVRAKNRQSVAIVTASLALTTAITLTQPGPALFGILLVPTFAALGAMFGAAWIAAGLIRGR